MGMTKGCFPVALTNQPEWTALSARAQVLYLRLWIDESATHVGTRHFHPPRLSRLIGGFAEDDVVLASEELQAAGFITVDADDQLVHLRGWLARDGLTRGINLAWPFRSAWDQVESPAIRESILSDLRASYDIDKDDFERGVTSRATNRQKGKAADPDGDGSFWHHSHIAALRDQMPQEPTQTPLDGLILTRLAPVALGRGTAQHAFARLDWLDMWAWLTLYLRVDNAGVFTGPAEMMLSRRASCAESSPKALKTSVRALAADGWIDTSQTHGDALRVRYFHLHEGSATQYKRGAQIVGEIERVQSDRLRLGAATDLALALVLGLAVPGPAAQQSFWKGEAVERFWKGVPAIEYDIDDLVSHGIDSSLLAWPKGPIPGGDERYPWVPRHSFTRRSDDTLTDGVTDTLTGGVTNTLTDRVTSTLTTDRVIPADARLTKGNSTLNSDPHTLTGGVTGGVTHTQAGSRFQVPGSRFEVRPSRTPSDATLTDEDGRTDGPTTGPAEDPSDPKVTATLWVQDLTTRDGGMAVGARDRLISLAAARLEAGQTLADLDGFVAEVQARAEIENKPGYLLRVLADPRRTAPRRPGATTTAGSAANRGAATARTAFDPFTDDAYPVEES